jgi:hypothetical protein
MSFSLSLSVGAAPLGYEVFGVMRVQNWAEGVKRSERRFEFAVDVNGSSWRIGTNQQGVTNRVQKACINDVMYTVYELPRVHSEPVKAKFEPGSGDQVKEGNIDRKIFPDVDGSGITYVWLTFASSNYLARASSDSKLAPPWVLDDPFLAKKGFKVPGRWQVERTTGLPWEIQFLNDGHLRFWNAERQKHEIEQYRHPWKDGFTNATFSVLSTTNIGGLVLPLTAEFTRVGLYDNERVFPITSVELRLTGGSLQAIEKDLRPEFSGTITIRDKRKVHVGSYTVRDGRWPE